GRPVTFSVAPLQTEPDTIERRWLVNGSVVATGGETFTFTPDIAGAYEIRLEVTDKTAFVRPSRTSMAATHTWQLTAGNFPKRRAARQ
ncbi:MAG TPA: hypothetical protein VF266_07980, partial [Thermoanaerobaculia bacterium]